MVKKSIVLLLLIFAATFAHAQKMTVHGTIFPLAMGFASDALGGQFGAIAVMTVGVIYLLAYTFKIKK